jgi:hypothetical protein
MIDAGVSELQSMKFGDSLRRTAEFVYRAMRRARGK